MALLNATGFTSIVGAGLNNAFDTAYGGAFSQAQAQQCNMQNMRGYQDVANQLNNTLYMQSAQSLAQAQDKAAKTGCKVETKVDRDFEQDLIRRTVVCGGTPIYWQEVDQQGRLVKDQYVSNGSTIRSAKQYTIQKEGVPIFYDKPKQETKVANETEKEIIPDISLARVGKWAIVLIVLMALGNRFWSLFGPKVSEQLHKALGAETPAAKT